MNGDTAVISSLDVKQKFSEAWVPKYDEHGEVIMDLDYLPYFRTSQDKETTLSTSQKT